MLSESPHEPSPRPPATRTRLRRYQINHEVGFTSGQRAYSDFLGISDDWTAVKMLNLEAVERGASCIDVTHRSSLHVCLDPYAVAAAAVQPAPPNAIMVPCEPCRDECEPCSGSPQSVEAPSTESAFLLLQVCFLTCLRFNFWEDCDRQPTLKIRADVPEDYVAADVKVLHFIAYRKLGMQVRAACPPFLLATGSRSTFSCSLARCA